MFLESKRLIIRDIQISDASFYFELFNDPDWIRFISDKNLKSVDETEKYLKKMKTENSKLGGLGFFTVVLKSTQELIGTSTALQRESLNFVDIGYGFLPKGRGKGYAIEATKLIINYVQETFNQKKVLAFTKPNNDKSQNLLKKLDFKFIGYQVIFDEDEDAVFELLKI
ncbi:GNAT family N-acetyltransferase [Polaribacter aquimarinus]|uniref:GNAT family N-acetyltransferase n=1 Tax=Polaribacter aquimarinus TaxID=2100726 RepID=A0A2U2JEL8_9FLAO|nr:GNAT family N-acetyltransferase [Polaribacter aquimarinus]PWG06779.1 GNAT family N-acetyltransferase [Polaribacter aquimarinus]